MELQDVKKVTVMGAGIMGQGIAHSFIIGGFDVILYNPRQPSLDIAVAHIKKNMQDSNSNSTLFIIISKNRLKIKQSKDTSL